MHEPPPRQVPPFVPAAPHVSHVWLLPLCTQTCVAPGGHCDTSLFIEQGHEGDGICAVQSPLPPPRSAHVARVPLGHVKHSSASKPHAVQSEMQKLETGQKKISEPHAVQSVPT